MFTKYTLSAKVETMILKNEVSTMKEQKSKIVSSLSYEVIREDPDLMKHFVGLTPTQFEVMFSFLNDVCPMEKIKYWIFGESIDSERSNNGPEPKFTSREKLFICHARLRRGFTLKTLAALLSSPDKKNYIYSLSHVPKAPCVFCSVSNVYILTALKEQLNGITYT